MLVWFMPSIASGSQTPSSPTTAPSSPAKNSWIFARITISGWTGPRASSHVSRGQDVQGVKEFWQAFCLPDHRHLYPCLLQRLKRRPASLRQVRNRDALTTISMDRNSYPYLYPSNFGYPSNMYQI